MCYLLILLALDEESNTYIENWNKQECHVVEVETYKPNVISHDSLFWNTDWKI